MKHADPLLLEAPGALCQARVVRVEPGGGLILRAAEFGSARARSAVGGYLPRPGDEVLVGADRSGNRFVVGVLCALRPAEPPEASSGASPTEPLAELTAELTAELVAEDGARATLEPGPEGARLRVRGADGALLFEHDPSGGPSRLFAPGGGLEIHAPEGDLSLRAGGRIAIESEQGIALRSRGPVELASEEPGAEGSRITLDADRAELRARTLRARAELAEALLTEGAVVADRLRVAAIELRQRAQTLEQRVDKVLLTAKRRYEEIEDLSQTRAGRLKLLASATLDAIADHALLRGREDTKIQGEKIYLA